jgi:dTDP-glucose 4,6-dehydratase
VHPQVETYWGNVNPVGPRSCYDESKRFAEALTMAYHRTHGAAQQHRAHLQYLRPAHEAGRRPRGAGVSGPGPARPVPLTVFGDGSQTRSFCYVSDLVDGLCRLMLSEERYPVNLGNPSEMTILEFARHIIRMTGAPSEVVYESLPQDDPQQRQPDIAKARAVLGWEPKVDLDEGLALTVEYFRGLRAKCDAPSLH